jgi:hypothetical protein
MGIPLCISRPDMSTAQTGAAAEASNNINIPAQRRLLALLSLFSISMSSERKVIGLQRTRCAPMVAWGIHRKYLDEIGGSSFSY